MDDSNKTVEVEQQTEFNAGIATLMRINEIKKGLIIATVNENWNMKFRYLKAYYFELISIMKDDKEEEEQDIIFKDVRKSYNQYLDAVAKGKKSIAVSTLDKIEDWEKILRNIEQKYGMNMPKQADYRFALMSKKR